MYDEAAFQLANPINRFAIGDRDPLKFNADGSLDIYIQHDSSGTNKESNWLPIARKQHVGSNDATVCARSAGIGRGMEPSSSQEDLGDN
jgi:hypothetical protein